jgi:pimeloyl-ACP methyl ester carboxylesterase
MPAMLVRIDPNTCLDVQQLGDPSNPAVLLLCATAQHYPEWGPVSAGLANYFHVTMYNHRGMGASDRGTSPITTQSLAADAAALLAALDVAKAHLLGWSLGSAVAQELVLLRPAVIESLVLWGTWSEADGYLQREFLTSEYVWQGGDLRVALNSLYNAVSEDLLNSPDFDPLEALMTSDFASTQKDQLRTVVEQWKADRYHNSTSRLAQITAPTLVITGEEDIVVPAVRSKDVAELIPGAQFHVFHGPGSSHALGVERPADFLEVVLRFLHVGIDERCPK